MPDQSDFTAALLDPDRPVPEGIIRPDGTPAVKRFNVYRNNVVTSLIEAMEVAFPVVRKLVGEAFFTAMARIFVQQHPPSSPLLMFYGAPFPDFLRDFPPAQSLPYLADVARLEHARRVAYHAADGTVAAPDLLASVPEDKLAEALFILHPSVQIIRAAHPVFSIWRFNSTDDKTPVPQNAEDVLVARPKMDVEMRLLPAGGAAFLAALQSGASLEAASGLAQSDSAAFDLGQNIGGILSAGILSSIKTN